MPNEAGAPLSVPESRYDLRILQAFRRVIRGIDLHSRRLASDLKITGPQLWCLLSITESGPLTSADLSRRVFLSPSTLVGILDRLEEKGYIRRERSSKDRRRIFLTTTDKGRELAERSPLPLQERLMEALKTLPASEQATITQSLEQVVDMLDLRRLPAAPFLETGPIQTGSKEAQGKQPLQK